MRTSSDEYIAVGLGLLTILVVAYVLYRPRIQQSKQYQATVVPLANIMDVGFIMFAPAIVLLVGVRAPFFMLGICAGRHRRRFRDRLQHPPLRAHRGSGWYTRPDRDRSPSGRCSARRRSTSPTTRSSSWRWCCCPSKRTVPTGAAVLGVLLLGTLIVVGMRGGMDGLNRMGDRTTAFNIAAVIGIVVAFVAANVQAALGGTMGPRPVTRSRYRGDPPDDRTLRDGAGIRSVPLHRGQVRCRAAGIDHADRPSRLDDRVRRVHRGPDGGVPAAPPRNPHRRQGDLRGVRPRRRPPAVAPAPRRHRQPDVCDHRRHLVTQRHAGEQQRSHGPSPSR